jgi:hypothetical protein
MKECVACKDDSIAIILHIPADAVLRMARCIQSLHCDRANLEGFAVLRRAGDRLTVLATDDLEGWRTQSSPLVFESAKRSC